MSSPSAGNNPRGAIAGSSESLEIYLREINKLPLITREEEHRIARLAQNGDEDALNKLVTANLRFVVSIAKHYSNQGLPMEDLINDGNVGLIKAARRFDVDRGFKFITYAVWWIRQAMLQSLAESSRIVRLPMNRASDLYRVTRASRALFQELGREPTPQEIAEQLAIPQEQVDDVLSVAGGSVSLDDPVPGDDESTALVERLADESSDVTDQQAHDNALRSDVDVALETLSKREADILRSYFGLSGAPPLTLEAIGKNMGLTRERIRQVKAQAIMKLRHTSRARFFQGHFER